MNQTDESLDQTLTRRSIVLGAGGLLTFGILASRLFYLQVTTGQDYRVLSENNRFNFQTLIPSRGRILDRNGEALAVNRQDFRLTVIPERIKDLDVTLSHLSNHIVLSDGQVRGIKRRYREARSFNPVLVIDDMERTDFSAVNFNLPDLPGLIPIVGEMRQYSEDGVFSHILGYVGRPSPRDIEREGDPVMYQPGFRIGKTGVEKAVDKTLRGEAGRLKVEVNAFGRVVREWPEDSDKAVAGQDVWLTLDAGLQRFGAEQFGDDSGGLAVMDVRTGELRTLLSQPGFDSNLFVKGLTQTEMDALNADERRPQFNKVLGGGYPAASTFKMVVLLAGLEAGITKPHETVFCNGRMRVGDRTFHCWKRQGHGWMDMQNSLKQSCDIYYYDTIRKLGMDRVRSMGERLGLAQVFDLKVDGQIRGVVPDPDWRRETSGQTWREGDSLNASIGQGFVLVTPLQLAVMTARIANGEVAIAPQLIINQDTMYPPPLGINPDHIRRVQTAMLAVTSAPGGTGYKPYKWPFTTVEMAGKTGTGQVRNISKAERISGVLKNNVLPWKYRDHSLFVGYAPFNQPRFAAGCIVEHGGSGAGRAADIVRNILAKALERDGITPDKPGFGT